MKTFKEFREERCCDDCFDHDIQEAEYQGKKVKLNDPIRGGSKKFYVYTKNEKGNVVKVSFGDTTGLSIKRDDPARRKSFRARHNCDDPGPKWKARYWSCYQWRANAKVNEAQGSCWDGYEQRGMKKKGDRMVPNCVPVGEEIDIDEATGNEIKKYMKSKWNTDVKASKVGTGRSMRAIGKIPNDFRAYVVKQFYPDAKILDKKNIDFGNIRPNYVSLRVGMWDELLKEQVEPELVEAKETGGVYVKYATAKKGPISQVYFSTRDQAEGFLQRINKMGAKGIISDKPTKGAIPMGHSQVRRQQEVEISEEDVEEGAWDSIDWRKISDLAKSNPKRFKKKTDWIEWLNTNVAPDNPAAAKKAQRAWESMDVDQILDFIEEQCKCSELSVSVDGRTKQFKETRKRIESRLAKLKEKLRQATKESFKK